LSKGQLTYHSGDVALPSVAVNWRAWVRVVPLGAGRSVLPAPALRLQLRGLPDPSILEGARKLSEYQMEVSGMKLNLSVEKWQTIIVER
jgi:hypothetical protein